MLKIEFYDKEEIKIYTWTQIKFEKGLFYRVDKNPQEDGIFLVTPLSEIYVLSNSGYISSVNTNIFENNKFVKYHGKVILSN